MERQIYEMLLEYVLHLDSPQENRERLAQCRSHFDEVTSDIVLSLVDDVMKRIDHIDTVKIIVTRMIHSFSHAINRVPRPFDRTFPPVERLLDRNDEINAHLDACSLVLKRARRDGYSVEDRKELGKQVAQISNLIGHYQEKENRLFPLLRSSSRNIGACS